jgi:hypothetical protein
MTRRGLVIFDASLDGHRAASMDALRKALGGETLSGVSPSAARTLFSAHACLFATAEGSLKFGAVIAAARSAVRRPTVLLSLRAHYSLRGRTAKDGARRLYWRAMRSLPHVTVLSIVPVEVAPGLHRVVDGSMFDPQWWDLDATETGGRVPTTDLARRLREAAGARAIVVSAGAQARQKGLEAFFCLWRDERVRERFLFAACGALEPGLAQAAAEFSGLGGHLEDRNLEDLELLDLFRVADILWCCFAPGYDQSSGIFGRALQFGRPCLVREGSLLERMVRRYGRGISLPWDDPERAAAALLTRQPWDAGVPLDPADMREQSLETLRTALRLSAGEPTPGEFAHR